MKLAITSIGRERLFSQKIPPLVACISFILLALFCSAVLASHNWDANAFVMQGSVYQRGETGGTIGYDGQFAYYIAAEPIEAAEHLDKPAYRYQRILYPFLAWLLTFGGNTILLPWALLAINIMMMVLAIYILAIILEAKGISAWYALSFLFFAGVLISVRADLNEPLALCLALGGLYFSYREKWIWAAVCLGLAVLAKETAVAFSLGIVAWLVWKRRFRTALFLMIFGLLPALLWGIILTAWLGQSPLSAQEAAMELLPFYGLRYIGLSPASAFILLWVALPALLLGAIGLFNLLRKKVSLELMVLFANVALVALMPRLTWINVAGALRATIGLSIASLIFLAFTRPRLLPWISAFWATSGLVLLPAVILGIA
jgi:hypothetical protein